MNKTYFLCSQEVINKFPNCERSKPFKSGYSFEDDINYYVAVLDFDEVEKEYEKVKDNNIVFFAQECIAGSMNINKITLKNIKQDGLFVEIENKLSLSKISNIAMVIYNLSQKYKCNPIEFINNN